MAKELAMTRQEEGSNLKKWNLSLKKSNIEKRCFARELWQQPQEKKNG